MPNFNDQPPLLTEEQAAASQTGVPSEIPELCSMLETALTEFKAAQVYVDGKYCSSFPMADVEAALRRIRAARRRCGELADRLLEMSPKTLDESAAVNKAMTACLAQVDVERMTCCPRLDAALGKQRPRSETASSEGRSVRVFPLNITPWKGWPKVGFPPKPR